MTVHEWPPRTGGEHLFMWTIFDHPSDWPDWFVARCFEITPEGPLPAAKVFLHREVEPIRQYMRRQGLTCLPRMDGDDPVILETWL